MKNIIRGKIPSSIILFFLITGFSYGQNLNVKDPSISSVYLQTDRSVYNSGDTIMFDAFILNDLSNSYKTTSDTLLIVLVDQDGLEVASETLPVNGFSTQGSLYLSKYLNEGNYVLISGTDKMKNISPNRIFSRILEIHEPRIASAGIRISLADQAYKPGDELKADILITNKKKEPEAVSYSYSLSDSKGVTNKGKGKSDGNGHASINITLPVFQAGETLTLNISASVKGADINTGIVIPTEYNSAIQSKYKAGGGSAGNNLVITLATDKNEYRKSEEVTGYITVTNKEKEPLYANLSVSTSGTSPEYFPLDNDNIITCSNLKSYDAGLDLIWCGILRQMSTGSFPSLRDHSADKGMLADRDLALFFGKALTTISHLPGHCFVVENSNDLKKIQRKQAAKQKAEPTGYSADRNIFDILKGIKPYQLVNNEIRFSTAGNYSVNFQKGAMIVIDGVKRGTDASILNSIPITDIAKITATTNPLELQRYSAMNSSGLVEITTKKGASAASKSTRTGHGETNSLFWKAGMHTDTSGKAQITYRNNDEEQEVFLTVEGITSDGLTGSTTISYKVR